MTTLSITRRLFSIMIAFIFCPITEKNNLISQIIYIFYLDPMYNCISNLDFIKTRKTCFFYIRRPIFYVEILLLLFQTKYIFQNSFLQITIKNIFLNHNGKITTTSITTKHTREHIIPVTPPA